MVKIKEDKNDDLALFSRVDLMNDIYESLLRVEKPHVILTGEPGVGKTSIIRYLEYLIDKNEVPAGLAEYKVSYLNLNDLLAGPGYRGTFEDRCKTVFRQYISGHHIVFIDEIHSAENLGGMSEGQAPGFGNFLKPILTENTSLKIIGATTNAEYDKMKDAALKRRFRRIDVKEPSREECISIVKLKMKRFNITDVKVEDADDLSEEMYDLSTKLDGQNPDKLCDIVDITFAKCRLNGTDLNLHTQELYLKEIMDRKTKTIV